MLYNSLHKIGHYSNNTNVSSCCVIPSTLLPLIHKRKEAEKSMPDTVRTTSQKWLTIFLLSPRLKQESRQLYKMNMF